MGGLSVGCQLRGVVHAVGMLDDALIGDLTPQHLDRVLVPKADAAWNLHELTRDLYPEQFVLFSSAAGVHAPTSRSPGACGNRPVQSQTNYVTDGGRLTCSLTSWALSKSLTMVGPCR